MPASHKIITKLRERRQIEAALRAMGSASSEHDFRRQAQHIAALGSQVIPALVRNLDGADARMLAAIGTVAMLLDRDEVVTALRQAVSQPHHTDQGMINALTILERFLGERLDDELLVNLSDPESSAISSLKTVLAQATANPAVLIEYIQGLDRVEPDVVLAVASSLQAIGGEQTVEPLRMMAQDVRDEIAAEALQVLGAVRLPQSARALQTLAPIVSPELRPLAERALRRLRFIGVEIAELLPPDPGWRALVSPMDGQGRQSLWFIQGIRWTSQARFLNILISDRAGAVEAAGHAQVPVQMLPPKQTVGHMHDIVLPDGFGAMLMLEIDFDMGRRLVLDTLALNRETQIPVAGALRLWSPWLWEASGADSLPDRVLPEHGPEDDALFADSDQLLGHPALASWTARIEATFQAAEKALRHPGWKQEVWIRRLAGELFADPIVAEVLSQRLKAASEWLLLAGDERRARMALLAAERLSEKDLKNQPFVQALVRRDLELALNSLTQEVEPV
jgi:hypothetical protein